MPPVDGVVLVLQQVGARCVLNRFAMPPSLPDPVGKAQRGGRLGRGSDRNGRRGAAVRRRTALFTGTMAGWWPSRASRPRSATSCGAATTRRSRSRFRPAGPAPTIRRRPPCCSSRRAGTARSSEHLASVPAARVDAVELIAAEAAEPPTYGCAVAVRDFFAPAGLTEVVGSTDGVPGNPPYIRFGTWNRLPRRRPGIDADAGVASDPADQRVGAVRGGPVLAVRPGGRVSLLLPAELLQVGYAATVRSYLVDTCVGSP